MDEPEPVIDRTLFQEPMFISRGSTYSALRFYDYQCMARGCNEQTHVRLFPNETPTPTLLCICGERAQGGEGMMVLVRGPYHPDDEAPADSVPAQP